MKGALLILTLLLAMVPGAFAQTSEYVNPHIRMDGTYVPGHYKDDSGGALYFQQGPIQERNPYTGLRNRELPYSNYNIHQPYPYYPDYYTMPEEYYR